MSPELSRPVRADTIGTDPRTISIEADEAERAALARRFGLVSIDALAAEFTLQREAAGIAVEGQVRASAVQACSVTGEPLPARIAETVRLRFVEGEPVGDEVELDEAAIDVLPIERDAIDLGEAAAETLALALDPFPRGPNAAAALASAGVIGEEAAGPFGALGALRDKLRK